jgi:hypothetical protein
LHRRVTIEAQVVQVTDAKPRAKKKRPAARAA